MKLMKVELGISLEEGEAQIEQDGSIFNKI